MTNLMPPKTPLKAPSAPLNAPYKPGEMKAPPISATTEAMKAEKKEEPVKGLYDNNFAAEFNLPPAVLTTKIMAAILGGTLFFGLFMGCALFGGSSTVTQQGLQGVINNPEVPSNRARCGISERTQGCVLYLMNATRRDREVRSFYDEASRLTGIPTYTIELGNIEYATHIIRPGYIAQINIPPIR